MPPEAMTSRNSNWRMRKGTMTGCPHLLHATGSSGGNSLEIQFFALQPPHTASRSGFLLWDVSDTAKRIAGIGAANKLRTAAETSINLSKNSPAKVPNTKPKHQDPF